MYDMTFEEWVEEFRKIVYDTYGIKSSEFCNSKLLPAFYRTGYSPIDTFEELDKYFEKEKF